VQVKVELGWSRLEEDLKLESRALNLDSISGVLYNTLLLFALLRHKIAVRPFLPFIMCNKSLALPNNILILYRKSIIRQFYSRLY
jgi:hypothetical protein